MRIQIKALTRADRFKCKFGIFNLLLKFGDFHVKLKRGSLSAISSLRFFPRLNSDFECLAEIADFCEFADTEILLGGEHPKKPVACTFGSSYEILLVQAGVEFIPFTKGSITIGPCCVFSTRTTVVSGATIGHNSIVGAGAVATGSYPPNSVITGIPGLKQKDRVSSRTHAFLEAYPWWTASYDWINRALPAIQKETVPEAPIDSDRNRETYLIVRLGLEDARIQSTELEGLIVAGKFVPKEKLPQRFIKYLDHFDANGPVEIDTNILEKCGL